jgi:hypothetical protein
MRSESITKAIQDAITKFRKIRWSTAVAVKARVCGALVR